MFALNGTVTFVEPFNITLFILLELATWIIETAVLAYMLPKVFDITDTSKAELLLSCISLSLITNLASAVLIQFFWLGRSII